MSPSCSLSDLQHSLGEAMLKPTSVINVCACVDALVHVAISQSLSLSLSLSVWVWVWVSGCGCSVGVGVETWARSSRF